MSEHFLLSRLARDLPVTKVIRMSEDAAYNWFRRARWPETKGKPYCPHCGVLECYVLTRRRFKCSGCRKEFSVTSGTIFASRKLPFRQILAIIALSANGGQGQGGVGALSRDRRPVQDGLGQPHEASRGTGSPTRRYPARG